MVQILVSCFPNRGRTYNSSTTMIRPPETMEPSWKGAISQDLLLFLRQISDVGYQFLYVL
jgi:hypothetical protein